MHGGWLYVKVRLLPFCVPCGMVHRSYILCRRDQFGKGPTRTYKQPVWTLSPLQTSQMYANIMYFNRRSFPCICLDACKVTTVTTDWPQKHSIEVEISEAWTGPVSFGRVPVRQGQCWDMQEVLYFLERHDTSWCFSLMASHMVVVYLLVPNASFFWYHVNINHFVRLPSFRGLLLSQKVQGQECQTLHTMDRNRWKWMHVRYG